MYQRLEKPAGFVCTSEKLHDLRVSCLQNSTSIGKCSKRNQSTLYSLEGKEDTTAGADNKSLNTLLKPVVTEAQCISVVNNGDKSWRAYRVEAMATHRSSSRPSVSSLLPIRAGKRAGVVQAVTARASNRLSATLWRCMGPWGCVAATMCIAALHDSHKPAA